MVTCHACKLTLDVSNLPSFSFEYCQCYSTSIRRVSYSTIFKTIITVCGEEYTVFNYSGTDIVQIYLSASRALGSIIKELIFESNLDIRNHDHEQLTKLIKTALKIRALK